MTFSINSAGVHFGLVSAADGSAIFARTPCGHHIVKYQRRFFWFRVFPLRPKARLARDVHVYLILRHTRNTAMYHIVSTYPNTYIEILYVIIVQAFLGRHANFPRTRDRICYPLPSNFLPASIQNVVNRHECFEMTESSLNQRVICGPQWGLGHLSESRPDHYSLAIPTSMLVDSFAGLTLHRAGWALL